MALTTDESRTRRGLVAGALGGVAAAVGTAIGRPAPAWAGRETDPEAVHKNVNNSTTASTSVTCSGATSIRAISTGAGTTKSGVFAQANGTSSRGVTGVGVTGVLGQSNGAAGRGVTGFVGGANATGVFGDATSTSGAPIGVAGRSQSPNGAGVVGENVATTGDAVGVGGRTSASAGKGVLGIHTATSGVGAGVQGQTNSTSGVGVVGRAEAATGGIGVAGAATHPSAVAGSFQGSGGAIALQAGGPVQFTTSGIATISSGSDAVVVSPGVDINATSKVLCTLMSDPGGGTTLGHVTKNNAADSFQINLSADATADCKAAWFVIS